MKFKRKIVPDSNYSTNFITKKRLHEDEIDFDQLRSYRLSRVKKELAKRPGVIKERSQLMDIAYKENSDIEDRTIDSHVKRIRKKFKKIDPDFSAIETRYGSGYRWNIS